MAVFYPWIDILLSLARPPYREVCAKSAHFCALGVDSLWVTE